MSTQAYDRITDRIIALLEQGTVPWQKPWKNGMSPQNLISRKAYRGINVFLLNVSQFASPFWLSFRQALKAGGSVKKGEHAYPVVFWKIREVHQTGELEKKPIPLLRYYNVFNVEQCEGIKAPAVSRIANGEFLPIERCEQVVAAMPKRPEIALGADRASYAPQIDKVFMPDALLFDSSESYYSTLFHELTHATGHSSRLGRKEVAEIEQFGSDPYSREELVAEMGAVFLSGHCGIERQTIVPSAAYIQAWLKRLKNDRKLIVHAAALAQRASDFIVGETQENHPIGNIGNLP